LASKWVKRFVPVLGAGLLIQGCGKGPLDLNTDDLDSLLSIANLNRRSITDRSDPPMILGLEIDADVVNVGAVTIRRPLTVTWTLLDPDGDRFASASTRIAGNFPGGETRHFSLVLNFPATASLDRFRDVVTFDLDRSSGQ
jgi:hypothetical protein